MHVNSTRKLLALYTPLPLALCACVSGATLSERVDYLALHTERTHDAAMRCEAGARSRWPRPTRSSSATRCSGASRPRAPALGDRALEH